MSADSTRDEICTVCGKSTAGNPGTAHLYHDGRRFALCCPICLDLFQRAPARFASGEHPQTLLQQMLEERKWQDSGR